MKLFKDLLMVNDPEKQDGNNYSQSRVYLFVSVIILLVMSLVSYFLDFDNKNFQYALDTVFWLSMFFGSYALIGKGLKYQHLQKILSFKGKLSKDIEDKLNQEELS